MHKRKILIVYFFCLFVLIFSKCINEQKKTTDSRGAAYAGSEKCIACHKEIYDHYSQTAHNLSSRPASENTIKGSFSKDSNRLYYKPTLKVAMEQTDSGFYQVAYINDVEKQAARFDIVIGSGRKGQSYLYWFDDNIFQLPVSYYVPGKCWINSPGFPPKNVLFNRSIPVGCFECHSAFIKKTATKPLGPDLVDYFDRKQIIYGIDCERCHGAAAAHVDFHEKNPLEKKPRFITNMAVLSRQQKLDMCAVCHSGAREAIASSFNFKPGDPVSKYLHPDSASLNTGQIDVHGRQYQLLTASKCFLKSQALNCSTCHNTHLVERDNLKNFSAKCLSCHQNFNHDKVEMKSSARAVIANNCIDCHMPARPSALITMTSPTGAEPIPALVRTHYIAVYPDETKKFLLKQ